MTTSIYKSKNNETIVSKQINSNHKIQSNKGLHELNILVGKWKTVGTHPYFPDTTFHGHDSFEWIEGGAFLIMHSEIDEPDIPNGVAIFGSDDSTEEYFMLYSDVRKVARKYDVSFQDGVLKWWRNSPELSQRDTLIFTDNGNTITRKGEMSRDGETWEKDLELTYSRIK